MFKKFTAWWLRIFNEGNHKDRWSTKDKQEYNPTLIQKAKAALLIMVTMFVAVFVLCFSIGVIISLFGPAIIGILALVLFVFGVIFMILSS